MIFCSAAWRITYPLNDCVPVPEIVILPPSPRKGEPNFFPFPVDTSYFAKDGLEGAKKIRNVLVGNTDGVKEEFIREDYTVKRKFVQKIEARFGVQIDRDCFASSQNARCEKYFTKKENALLQKWDNGEVLWLNPPWSLWPKVVKKLQAEKCTAICVCPDWHKGWVRKIFRMVKNKFRFEEGTELFEVHGKTMDGIRWGVWALLVEGGGPKSNPIHLAWGKFHRMQREASQPQSVGEMKGWSPSRPEC